MKKIVLLIIMISSLNCFSQTVEKFMKLQRVFSVDAFQNYGPYGVSGVSTNYTVYSYIVPNNVVWVVKNVYWKFNFHASSINNNDLMFDINNTNILINSNPSSPYQGLSSPLTISAGSVLKFRINSGGSSNLYSPVGLYFSVEEYVVE